MKIHITILGKEALPVYYPIVEFEQEVVHIIGTKQNEDISNRLSNILVAKGVECLIHIVDVFNLQQISDVCESIHQSSNPSDSFMYNLTGGTKLMALGAFAVAQKYNAKVIYTDSRECYDINTNEHTPLTSLLDFKTIFELQGQRLKSYIPYERDENVLAVCKKIMELKLRNKAMFKTVMDFAGNYSKKISELPFEFATNGYTVVAEDDCVTIVADNEDDVTLKCKNAKKLFFEGRWWETLVADAICKWSGGRYEIWHDVTFQPKEATADNSEFDKNEVDVLVNIGNTFLFVECKSGIITQDNIYKMECVRKVYGSEKSKSVLVSFYSVFDDLKEKANDQKIDVIDPIKKENYVLPVLRQISKRFELIVSSLKV